jgi:hypothetical protein
MRYRRGERVTGLTEPVWRRPCDRCRGAPSEGGLLLASGDRLIPEPVLMGRDPSGPTKAVIEVAAPAMLGAIMAFP